jgi:hypothetical protein
MPQLTPSSPDQLDPRTRDFYLHALALLDEADVPYLVGGAYSLAHHAGIVRHTKDLDLFIRRQDYERVARVLQRGGYPTRLVFPHWLGKAFFADAFVDLIFGSGNGLCQIDDDWFAHAVSGEALGRQARLVPAEEVIWTKSFVQERERFDGADIAHVLLARGPQLDWDRLIRRFGLNHRVLLAHLILFGYIYPSHRHCVPRHVMDRLLQMVRDEPQVEGAICRGTLLSRQQYLIDINERGFIDARQEPLGPMTRQDIELWTAAIDTIK